MLRTNELAEFEHYLQVRQPVLLGRSRKRVLGNRIGLAGFVFLISLGATSHLFGPFDLSPFIVALEGIGLVGLGVAWYRAPGDPLVSPDQEILIRADRSAAVLWQLMRNRRLRSSLHPGVLALLKESAGFWKRVVAVNQNRIWGLPEVVGHWSTSRQDWTRAADLAMAETMILAEESLTLRAPRSKAEEVIEEVLDIFGAKKTFVPSEPLPPQFRELRELADKLSILAREVESVLRGIESEPQHDSRGSASRRLEDVLGQMQALKRAEEELKQVT